MIIESAVTRSIDTLYSYGYPPELYEAVNRFVDNANEIFLEYSPGVLLIGSSSRGELSWSRKNDQVRLYSDIEFLVAVNKKDKKSILEFENKINLLEKKCAFGDLFHIDYTIIPWAKLPGLEKKFFIYESKVCGIDLTVESVASNLPEVSRENISWKELNEVLVHRLTSILHVIPASIFYSSMTETERQTVSLNLAKNSLDITTWLHPYESDRLVAGFTNRLKCWSEAQPRQLKLLEYLGDEELEYLDYCLSLRGNPDQVIDINQMIGKTINIYKKSILYCKSMNDIKAGASLDGVLVSSKIFDEYGLRQRARQIIGMAQNTSLFGLKRLLVNSINVRKGMAANVCNYMLCALDEHLNSGDRSQYFLGLANEQLSGYVAIEANVEEDFAASWLKIRADFRRYQNITRNY